VMPHAMTPQPPGMFPPMPPAMLAQSALPASLRPPLAMPTPHPPAAPPPGYGGWGVQQPDSPAVQAMYDRQQPRQPAAAPRFKPRRPALKPWMLVIGALIMALLAFAVTRACIHTATRPAAESK
jgi:hypothetical protein